MNGPDRKKPTLKEVAKQLGVSTATVSNAFNRPDQLSSSLRERILAQCNKLGYTGPSVTARSLRTGKTGVIGVLLADNLTYSFTDPVSTLFLSGISETLDSMHVNMLLLPPAPHTLVLAAPTGLLHHSMVLTAPTGLLHHWFFYFASFTNPSCLSLLSSGLILLNSSPFLSYPSTLPLLLSASVFLSCSLQYSFLPS